MSLMRLMKQLVEKRRFRTAEKYWHMLLADEIRLQDIPQWLLHDPQHCRTMCILAFRVDRALSEKRYRDDLTFLESEILHAQIRGEKRLAGMLQQIRDDMSWGLETFKKIEPPHS